ncbi:MAG: 6-phosphogluconolactonase [Clostridia bacterium]|nr:6-phosphogluconolactonase [Clostridia bacterium]
MEQHIFKQVDELENALAKTIQSVAQAAVAARGQFNFVLAGGNSPRRLYELLSSDAFKNNIAWSNTWFFFGDERFVPANDQQRNSLMAKEALFDPLKIEPSHIFTVDTNRSPSAAAQHYSETIATHFHHKPVHFDFVLLGLGDDAHTASLFPFTSVLQATEPTVQAVFLKEKDIYRITMTAPLINQARHIAFMVYGKNKAEAVAHVLKSSVDLPQQYPAQLIRPTSGQVHWFLDEQAASLL